MTKLETLNAWITLAMDMRNRTLFIAGMGETELECKSHRNRVEVECEHVRAFQIKDSFGDDVANWLWQIGVPVVNVQKLVRGMANELLRLSEHTNESK